MVSWLTEKEDSPLPFFTIHRIHHSPTATGLFPPPDDGSGTLW
jgi:hypothetical protein